jgi:FtsH-binding integral membrane protein
VRETNRKINPTTMSRFSSRSFDRIDWDALFKTNDLTPRVQLHLRNTYIFLAMTVLSGACGVFFDLKYNVGGITTLIAMIGLIFTIFWTPNTESNALFRFSTLLAFGFVKGLSIGSLVEDVMAVDPTIPLKAFVGTSCVFACFSLAAIFSSRRSMFYLGAILSTAITTLTWVSFLYVFFPTAASYNFLLYGGLLVFSGYVVFDTQLIIAKAQQGDFDAIRGAFELFVDFVAIFVRLMRIMSKKKK